MCIGQTEVEQDDIDRVLRKMALGVAHGLHVRECGVLQTLLLEHLAQQTRVARIILDQQDRSDRFPVHSACVCCGSLTLVSQNSMMLFTSPSNSSS